MVGVIHAVSNFFQKQHRHNMRTMSFDIFETPDVSDYVMDKERN